MGQCKKEARSRQNVLKIFQNNHSVGVTWQTNLTQKWKITEYFGENLNILTDLTWIFNDSNWFQNIFSKYLGGITLLSYSAGVLISKAAWKKWLELIYELYSCSFLQKLFWKLIIGYIPMKTSIWHTLSPWIPLHDS